MIHVTCVVAFDIFYRPNSLISIVFIIEQFFRLQVNRFESKHCNSSCNQVCCEKVSLVTNILMSNENAPPFRWAELRPSQLYALRFVINVYYLSQLQLVCTKYSIQGNVLTYGITSASILHY